MLKKPLEGGVIPTPPLVQEGLKDIFNVYSLGEGSIQSLPNNMVRSETRYVSQEVQNDSCLSRTLFASKSEIEDF